MRVNGHSLRWLKQGFCWVYPNEVVGGLPRKPGTEVELEGPGGEPLGRGVSDSGWIAVRRFREDAGKLDAAWMRDRLERAIDLRERLRLGDDTTGYRLVHGENDGLPGIRVDWWNGWVVIALDTPAVAPILPLLCDALEARLAPQGIYLCYRPDPRDDVDLKKVYPAPQWLRGEGPEGGEVVVHERGVAMRVRPDDGPDVGMYADMRGVRDWLRPHWAGRRVLNTFSYTGLFSVAAAVHGAAEAVSVDLGGPALERLAANLAENGLDPADHERVEDDVFRAFDRFRRTGRRFDLVILDPPSFSHGPAGTWSAKKDTPRLVAAAARVTERRGWLVAASNQGQLSPKAFRGMVAEGLRKAGREGRELSFHGAAPDFPAAVSFPEGHYLKVGVWALD